MRTLAPLSLLALAPRALALGLSLGLSLGVMLWSAAPAAAEEPPPPKETRFFESYDKNLDGKVTLEEFQAGGGESASFALLDGDKDGTICPEELGLPADYRPLPVEKRPKGHGGDQPGGAQPGGGKPRAGAGGAGARGGEWRKKLQEMDGDGDGKVSPAEWKGPAEGFAKLDRNGDGVLDAADLMGGQGGEGGTDTGMELVKRRWAEMDADGDGKITPAEWKGELPFERVDADQDGVLTDKDLKAMREAFGRAGAGAAGKGPGAPGAGDAAGRGPKELTAAQLDEHFAALDKDGSGQLEAAELPEPVRERQMQADANGDGALSRGEYEEGYRRQRNLERAMRERNGPKGAGPGGPGGSGGGPGGPGGPGGGPGGPGGAGGGPGAGPAAGGAPGLELLRRFDHDRDGKVTREQFPGSDEKFAALDKNGDGVLTAEDFPAPPAAPAAPVAGAPAAPGPIARLDKDGDGRLSRAEFPGSDDEWRRLDVNHDGWITTDEAPPR